MKEYDVSRDIKKELSLPLLSFLGRSLTEEHSKIAEPDKGHVFDMLNFDYDDGYESFKENTIEKFMEECILKPKCTINFSLYKAHRDFSIRIEYGTTITDLLKIKIPNARFDLHSHTTDQIWSEGIVNKFLKLIKEFDISQTNEKPLEVKTNEKPLEVKTNEKSNRYLSFLKNHLPPIVIGLTTSIIGGIIVILYFTYPF